MKRQWKSLTEILNELDVPEEQMDFVISAILSYSEIVSPTPTVNLNETYVLNKKSTYREIASAIITKMSEGTNE